MVGDTVPAAAVAVLAAPLPSQVRVLHPPGVQVGEEPSLEGAELVTLHQMKLVYSRVVNCEARHGLVIHQPVFLEQISGELS